MPSRPMPYDPVERMRWLENEKQERIRAVERFGSRPKGLEELRRGGGKDWATVLVAAVDSHGAGRATADWVCDGEDDQETIIQAIESLPEVGGKVVLLEGRYSTSDQIISTRNNITLEGVAIGGEANQNESPLGTRIACNKPGFSFGEAVIRLTGKECIVSRMYLRCDSMSRGLSFEDGYDCRADTVFVSHSSDRGFYSDDVRTVFFNCTALLCNRGFGIEAWENMLIGCHAWNCITYGFQAGSGIVVGCDSAFCGDSGFGGGYNCEDNCQVVGSKSRSDVNGFELTDSSVVGCRVTGASSRGVILRGESILSASYIEEGPIFTGTYVGVEVLGDAIVVQGNWIRGGGTHGILVSGSNDGSIIGNRIDRFGRLTNATYDGIHLDNSDRMNVQMNTVRTGLTSGNRTRYGINVATSTCNDCFVTNNDLMTSGVTGSFNDAGTGTVTTAGNRL